MAKKNYKALLNTITTLIFDIDGVLTDSSLLVQTNGDLLRKMHTRDGYALRAAVEAGLNIFIISPLIKKISISQIKSITKENLMVD